MKPKITVIVPIYNAEKYLERCINSLLFQTMGEFEIILVNDGSTDGSGVIINNFTNMDSRIVSIHQSNKGVSAARNKGLYMSKGEYICFVDADDWVEPDMLEKLYEAAEVNNCDIVVCNYEYELEGRKQKTNFDILKNKVFKKEEIIDHVLKYLFLDNTFSSVCNKLYKSSFLIDMNIEFQEDKKFAEDFLFNLSALKKANRLIYINNCEYHYCENFQSASHCEEIDLLQQSVDFFLMCDGLIHNKDIGDVNVGELKTAISLCFVKACISILYQYIVLKRSNSLHQRWIKVLDIINNDHVQRAIVHVEGLISTCDNKFIKYMTCMIKGKKALRIVTCLSYIKCKSKIAAIHARK